ncbi:MAG: energy-coupling factor ABC transporter ATP-binding protein [Anaerolineae bacterium]|nr:energy-coupling factor ABC transporter ATP-binding protein [Thermoflexus sp.]MDW8065140.1 energy-coupling factor ABC transporter ATP-binding protein [Anaerolineae bacterium]
MGLLIEAEGLVYIYPDGHPALQGVSLRMERGEKVAVVGPNGAGKSTLLLVLSGLLRPTAGVLRVEGRQVGNKDGRRLRTQVGLVFQDPDDQLFSLTVFDDVAFGPIYQGLSEQEVRERVTQALDAVGMAWAASRISHHLSVGEKKRVAIATVLALRPEILLLDEPTAGLDPRGRRELIGLLRDLPQTMLVATHDMRLVAELLPRVIIMDQGRIVADGPTSEILRDERLLEAHGLEPPYPCPAAWNELPTREERRDEG